MKKLKDNSKKEVAKKPKWQLLLKLDPKIPMIK